MATPLSRVSPAGNVVGTDGEVGMRYLFGFLFICTIWIIQPLGCGDGGTDGCGGSGGSPGGAVAHLVFNETLAYRWAPIHTQDVDTTGSHSLGGKADYITNIDFDGDWDMRNNWDNAPDLPLRAYVYYSVVTTKTHWFIVYAFFHPRDWHDVRLGSDEHENDMEGVLAIIKRPDAFAFDDFGEMLGIITVFHNDFFSFTPAGSPLTDGEEHIQDRDLALLPYDVPDVKVADEKHPRTAAESKGHGIKIPREITITGERVKYFPKGNASVQRDPDDRDVGYQLVWIFDDLWWLDVPPYPNRTFHEFGVFSGDDGWDDNAANAPWAWDDWNDGSSLQGGELALDPAKLVQTYFNGLGGDANFSRQYTYNAYKDIYCDFPDGC